MNRKNEYLDERWKARAAEIRRIDDNKCAMCGCKDKPLHVHHLSYPPQPFHIWDSTDNEMVTLCEDCHKLVHQSKKRPVFHFPRRLTIEGDAPKYDWMDIHGKQTAVTRIPQTIRAAEFDVAGHIKERLSKLGPSLRIKKPDNK